MTQRRLSSFVDALAAGRRPGSFKAGPEDVEVLRAAIALRAARPGDATPDERFVSDLHQRLAEQAATPVAANIHPIRARRPRAALVAVAAGLALVGGTFVATETLQHSNVTTSALQPPNKGDLRAGTFLTSQGSVLGQIVAYRGHPSWVYMDVGVPQLSGTITCKLQLDDGSIVAAGAITIHGGSGELSKSVRVSLSRLRGAQLFAPNGAVLASATFA
jgi:hypothetical protein